METTPLLSADPPIDDESFHNGDRIFPSPLQKYLILSEFSIACATGKLFELGISFYVALFFNSSLVPVSLYTLWLMVVAAPVEKMGRRMAHKRSRMLVLSWAIAQQTLVMVLLCTLLLLSDAEKYKWLTLAGVLVLILWQRLCAAVHAYSMEDDWARVLANHQTLAYSAMYADMTRFKSICHILSPLVAGSLIQSLGFDSSLKAIRLLLLLAGLVEYSLVRKLFSTCYALRMHSSVDAQEPRELELSSPRLNRILMYIKRRPAPVCVSVGAVLIRVTILVLGPQQVAVLLYGGVGPRMAGLLRALQFIVLLVPFPVAVVVFVAASVSAVLTLHTGSYIAFGVCCVFTRIAVHTIDRRAKAFIQNMIADKEVFKVYYEVEKNLSYICDLVVASLPLIWSQQKLFIYPVSISVAFSLAGLIVLEGARWWPSR